MSAIAPVAVQNRNAQQENGAIHPVEVKPRDSLIYQLFNRIINTSFLPFTISTVQPRSQVSSILKSNQQPQALGTLCYSWTFANHKLTLYEDNGQFQIWLQNKATGIRKLQPSFLEKITGGKVLTAEIIIRCINACVLTVTPNSADFQRKTPIKTWACSEKVVQLVQVGDARVYLSIHRKDKKTYQSESLALVNPTHDYPVEDENQRIVPALLNIYHTWASNGRTIELVQVGNEVFLLLTQGTVSTKVNALPSPPGETQSALISRYLEYDVEILENGALSLTPLLCHYTWKGDTEYTLMSRGDNLSIRIVKKEGLNTAFSRAALPNSPDPAAQLVRILSSEIAQDENGEWNFQLRPNNIDGWVVDHVQISLIHRFFQINGVQKEQLECLSVGQKAARIVILAEGTIAEQIGRAKRAIPILNSDSTIRGLYSVCKQFPPASGKEISLLTGNSELAWHVKEVITGIKRNIRVDFSRDFPLEAQISFLKNQIASEAFLESFAGVIPENLYEYHIYKSAIKEYLWLRSAVVDPLGSLAPSGEALTLFEMKRPYSSGPEICLLRIDQEHVWEVYEPSKNVRKRIAFDFNEIMKNLAFGTRLWFAKNFKVEAFDPVHNQITTVRETTSSRFDPKKIIDSDVWAVTLVNVDQGNKKPRHAMIAFEGMQNGMPFFEYAHFNEKGFHIFERNCEPKKNKTIGPTWLRDRSQVESMMETINIRIRLQKEGKSPLFNKLGGARNSALLIFLNLALCLETVGLWTLGNYLYRQEMGIIGEGGNCIEGAKRMLRDAGIIARERFNYIYSAPDDYLNLSAWKLTGQSLTGSAYMPTPFDDDASYDVAEIIQKELDRQNLGNKQWTPIKPISIWKADFFSQKKISNRIIFSILLRGENMPRKIDITDHALKEIPKILEAENERNSLLRNHYSEEVFVGLPFKVGPPPGPVS